MNTQYNELVYNGFWFSPEREALEALVTEMQRDVAGVVRLRLYKATPSSPDEKARKVFTIQTWPRSEGDTSAYDQSDATGFIRLNALRLKLRALRDQSG